MSAKTTRLASVFVLMVSVLVVGTAQPAAAACKYRVADDGTVVFDGKCPAPGSRSAPAPRPGEQGRPAEPASPYVLWNVTFVMGADCPPWLDSQLDPIPGVEPSGRYEYKIVGWSDGASRPYPPAALANEGYKGECQAEPTPATPRPRPTPIEPVEPPIRAIQDSFSQRIPIPIPSIDSNYNQDLANPVELLTGAEAEFYAAPDERTIGPIPLNFGAFQGEARVEYEGTTWSCNGGSCDETIDATAMHTFYSLYGGSVNIAYEMRWTLYGYVVGPDGIGHNIGPFTVTRGDDRDFAIDQLISARTNGR